jgi:L-ascorbate metabolism protein UlaG (beta-lactamase superfamily)
MEAEQWGARDAVTGDGTLTIEWLGVATFRVRVAGRTLFFDTYLDRPPSLADVGLTSAEVGEADFCFISHAHYDHLLGADVIAKATGAMVVGSYETARVLRDNDVAAPQILAVSGGETVAVGGGVTVRVFPALHSCLFATSSPHSGAECLGDLGVSAQERKARVDNLFELIPTLGPEVAAHLQTTVGHSSPYDGGQLAYLLQTRDGSVLISGSAGGWTGIWRGLRPDVAVLALNGRPNVDGEPYQGSLAHYLVDQVELLRPSRVVLCHHDELLPPIIPAVDTGEALAALADRAGYARHVDLRYHDPVPILS